MVRLYDHNHFPAQRFCHRFVCWHLERLGLGPGPLLTWSVTSGSLPNGTTIKSAQNPAGSGSISGIPTLAGTFNFTVQVTDGGSNTATQPLTIVISALPLSFNTASLPNGMIGTAYSATLNATGGSPAYVWSITSGSLPPGSPAFALNSSTGAITGTPTVPGTYPITFQVCDQVPTCISKPLPITITSQSCASNVSRVYDASMIPYPPLAGALTPFGSAVSMPCPVDNPFWSIQNVSTPLGTRQMFCSPVSGNPPVPHSYGMFVNAIQDVGATSAAKVGSANVYNAAARFMVDAGLNFITDYNISGLLSHYITPGGATASMMQSAWLRPQFIAPCSLNNPPCTGTVIKPNVQTDSLKEIYQHGGFAVGYIAGSYSGGHDPDYSSAQIGNFVQAYFTSPGQGSIYASSSPWLCCVMLDDGDWNFSLGGGGDRWLDIFEGQESARYNGGRGHSSLSLIGLKTAPYQYAMYWDDESSIGPRPYSSTVPAPTAVPSSGGSLTVGTFTYSILLSQQAGQELGPAIGYTSPSCTTTPGNNECILTWKIPSHQQIDNPDGFQIVRQGNTFLRVLGSAVCAGGVMTPGTTCIYTDDGSGSFVNFANGFNGNLISSSSRSFGMQEYVTPVVATKATIVNTLQNGDAAQSYTGYGHTAASIVQLNQNWLLPNRASCTVTTLSSCDIDNIGDTNGGTDGTRFRAESLGAGTQNFSMSTIHSPVDPRSIVIYYTTDATPANDASECKLSTEVGYSPTSPCKPMATDDGNAKSMIPSWTSSATNVPYSNGCILGDALGAYDTDDGAGGTAPTGSKWEIAGGGGKCAGGTIIYPTGAISLKFIFPPTTGRVVIDYSAGGYGSGKGLLDVRGTSNFTNTFLWGGIIPSDQRGWWCHLPNDGPSTDGTCTVNGTGTPTRFMTDSDAWGFSIARSYFLGNRTAIDASFAPGANTIYFGTTYEGGGASPERPYILSAAGSSYTDAASVPHAHIVQVYTNGNIPLGVGTPFLVGEDQAKIDYIYQYTSQFNTQDSSGLPDFPWYLTFTYNNVDSIYAPADNSSGGGSFPPACNGTIPNCTTGSGVARGAQHIGFMNALLNIHNTVQQGGKNIFPGLGAQYWSQQDHTNSSYGVFGTIGYENFHGVDPGGIQQNIVGNSSSIDYLACPMGAETPTLASGISAGSGISVSLAPDLGYPSAPGDSYDIEDDLSGTNLETVSVSSVPSQTSFVAANVAHTHPSGAFAWNTKTAGVYGDATTQQRASWALWLAGSSTLRIPTASCPSGFQNSIYAGCTITATGGSGTGYVFTVNSGALCDGLSLSSGGAISGTMTTVQVCNFTIKVTDSLSASAVSGPLTIQDFFPVLGITTASCPGGSFGTAYDCVLTYAGGNGNNTWTIFSGMLPSGLIINPSTGEITGTPTVVATPSRSRCRLPIRIATANRASYLFRHHRPGSAIARNQRPLQQDREPEDRSLTWPNS